MFFTSEPPDMNNQSPNFNTENKQSHAAIAYSTNTIRINSDISCAPCYKNSDFFLVDEALCISLPTLHFGYTLLKKCKKKKVQNTEFPIASDIEMKDIKR